MQNNLFYYSFNFESTVITQPYIDGWLCNQDYAYLNVDAPVGQEERLIVMGNKINNGAYQYFSVIAGYDRERFNIVRDDYVPSTGSAFPQGAAIGSWEGIHGGRKLANGLENTGIVLQAFPLTAPLRKGLSTAGAVYNSALDYKQYSTEKATVNTGIRLVSFGLGEGFGRGISKSGLDKNMEHVRKIGVDQALKLEEDAAIELKTSKDY